MLATHSGDRATEINEFIALSLPNCVLQVEADDIGTYIEDVSPFFNVFTYNGIKLVDGFNNKAAQLDGNNQYIDLGDHTDVCFGDLKRCRQGFTMSHYFKINELRVRYTIELRKSHRIAVH